MSFYQTVSEEFQQTCSPFLCNGSDTFEKCWRENRHRREMVKDHARNFLKSQTLEFNIHVPESSSVLFDGMFPLQYNRYLRLLFMEYCIKNQLNV